MKYFKRVFGGNFPERNFVSREERKNYVLDRVLCAALIGTALTVGYHTAKENANVHRSPSYWEAFIP